MKKQLLLSIVILIFIGTNLKAQQTTLCGMDNATWVPEAPTENACLNGEFSETLVIKNYTSQPDDFDTHKIVVVGPYQTIGSAEGEFIKGVSSDGSYDFTAVDIDLDASYELGVYKFYPFAFNQDELDNVATVVNATGLAQIDCCPAELSPILLTVKQVLLEGAPLTLAEVENAICETLPGLGLTINYSLGEPYEVTLIDDVNACSTVGLKDFSVLQSTNIHLSPVPATDILSVQLYTDVNNVEVSVYDINGKKVSSQNTSGSLFSVDVSNLADGIYFVTINDGVGMISKRFTKN